MNKIIAVFLLALCMTICVTAYSDGVQALWSVTTKNTTRFRAVLFLLVENTGIEPVTSCMPCKRSPS